MTKNQIYRKIHRLPKHSRHIFWVIFETCEATGWLMSFEEVGNKLYHMRAENADKTRPITWSSIKGAFGCLRENGLLINSTEVKIKKGIPFKWEDTKIPQTYATIFNIREDESDPTISYKEYHNLFYEDIFGEPEKRTYKEVVSSLL